MKSIPSDSSPPETTASRRALASPIRGSSHPRVQDPPFEFLPSFEAAADDAPTREFDLAQIASRHKWLLVTALLGGLALGHLAFLKLGPEYDAVARILVSRQVQVPVRESLTQALYSEGRGEHVEIIRSPMIVRKAIENGQLDKLPSLQRSDDPVEDILDALQVKRTAGQDNSTLNVFEIKYRNRQREDSRAVVNAIIAAYHDYLLATKQETTSELAQQIAKMDGELAKRIEQKQQELLEFRRNAPLLWRTAPGEQRQPGDVTNVHQERVVEIERDRRQNLLRRAEINGKIRALQNAIDQSASKEELESVVRLLIASSQAAGGTQAAGPNSLLSPTTADVASSQLLPLLIEEQKLLRDFADDHPDVVNVRRSIAKLKEFYESRGISLTELLGRGDSQTDLATGYMRFLKQQLEELDQKDAELTAIFEAETQAVKDIVQFTVEDQARSEELDRLKAQWNAIVNNVSHLDLTRDSQDYSMKLLAPVREEWSLKRYLKIVGAVTMLILGLCVAVVGLREWRDTTLKTVEDVRRFLGDTQVLGSVPRFDTHFADVAPDVPLEPALCYLHRPASAEAESYRSVRTALLVGLTPRQKVIQISSAEPGDGKSTFAANLAIAFAQTGKRVLLLDADLRRPTIHHLFHAREEIGTTEVLAGEIQFQNAIQESPVANLWLLTAGQCPENPAETLSSARFDELLAEARRSFDVILLDTPPLLVVSDPCIVAARTDGLVLVVRTEKNTRLALRQVKNLVQQHGIPLLGAVANGVRDPLGEYTAYASRYEEYLEPHRPPGRSSKSRRIPQPT